MKTISLWQPWAAAIALGLKTIETRHWATAVRGRIAIHAAKRASADVRAEFDFFVRDRGFGLAFAAAGYTDFEDLPRGAIVATCELADCLPVERIKAAGLAPAEAAWGNYGGGRFGWILRNVRPLPVPVPFTGRQGFFDCSEGGVIPAQKNFAPQGVVVGATANPNG
jgi:hypothetical protein